MGRKEGGEGVEGEERKGRGGGRRKKYIFISMGESGLHHRAHLGIPLGGRLAFPLAFLPAMGRRGGRGGGGGAAGVVSPPNPNLNPREDMSRLGESRA